jgi:hypothetical protein
MKYLIWILGITMALVWISLWLVRAALGSQTLATPALVTDAQQVSYAVAGAQAQTATAATALANAAEPGLRGIISFRASPDAGGVAAWAITACEVAHPTVCATYSPTEAIG